MEEHGAFKLALKVDPLDNVATLFANSVLNGMQVGIQDKQGKTQYVTVIGDIPYGHKIAVQGIDKGSRIIKYGECIGAASRAIQQGEYVHIHNMEALRGRGDWKEGKLVRI